MYQRFWFVDASMLFMKGSIQEEDQSFKPVVCHNNELPIGIVKSKYKDFVLDYKTPYFLVDSLVGIDSPNNGFSVEISPSIFHFVTITCPTLLSLLVFYSMTW